MILDEPLIRVSVLVTRPVFCSQCDFLEEDAGRSPAPFSASLLHVAAGDLQQLMAAFRRVYEADLRAYCCRDLPGFSADADVFRRTQRLLTTLVTVGRDRLGLQTAPEGASARVVSLRSWRC